MVYVLFPFDLITDLVPVIGQLDDVTALLVSSKVFIELSPPEVVARHMRSIRRKDEHTTIEADEETSPTMTDEAIADAIIIDGEHELIPQNDES